MALVGIDAVTYGVADVAKGVKAFQDFGLKKIKGGTKEAILETGDGSRVIIRQRTDKTLPKAIQRGSCIREMTWGVEKAADLARVRRALEGDRAVTVDREGTVRSVDDMGLGIAFRKTRRRRIRGAKAGVINAPNAIARVNERAVYYDRATPRTIGHAVFNVADLNKVQKFYVERLGFEVSDYYRGRGVFLRCRTPGGHHNLFFLGDETGKNALNHLAFGVADIHELFAGGIHFTGKGWKTAVGPGRHIISSCYFWYFNNPCGGNLEYYVDEDFITEGWKPRQWNPDPKGFAEWAVADGVNRFAGQPPTRTRADMKK